LRSLTIVACAAVFLSASAAFGTDAAPMAKRFVFWVALLALGTVANQVARAYCLRRPSLLSRPRATTLGLALGLSAALTPAIIVMVHWVFGAPSGGWASAAYIFATSATISLAMSALHILAARRNAADSARVQTNAGPISALPPRFLERLPPKLRGAALYALEAEDHYLRLHTSRGSDLILMRLSDAIAELEGLEGARTHRSWWVAREAVQGADRSDNRISLTLPGGLTAPVSRTYAKDLREAGWF
jgi:DNA-binding LytR/AlgR family response regulator